MAVTEKKARVAVLISGGGTNLQALINSEKKGELKSGEIVLVVSNSPSAYGLKRAEKAKIPTEIITKKAMGSQKAFEEELKRVLLQNRIDLIVLAGFLAILSKDFTDSFPERIINVHPSLIPSFCGEGYYGIRVHEEALKKGVKVTGATVHFVNEIPDAGKIILQKAVKVCENDTPEALQKRVMRLAEWQLLPKAAEMVCAEIINRNGD